MIAGAVAQTPKSAPKTAEKKSAPTATAPAASAKKNTAPVKKTTATKPTTTAKKTARSKKRIVARKRVQTEPTSDRYTEIQEALIARGHSTGPATGTWSADWTDALKRFQQDQKLEVTGKIDALSLIRLGLGPKREVSTAKPAGLEASEPRSPAAQ